MKFFIGSFQFSAAALKKQKKQVQQQNRQQPPLLAPSSKSLYKITHVLLTKCEIKITGYWPNSFIVFCGQRQRQSQGLSSCHQKSLNDKGYIK